MYVGGIIFFFYFTDSFTYIFQNPSIHHTSQFRRNKVHSNITINRTYNRYDTLLCPRPTAVGQTDDSSRLNGQLQSTKRPAAVGRPQYSCFLLYKV